MTSRILSGKPVAWISRLHQQTVKTNHRVALVISGDKEWCCSVVNQIIETESFKSIVTVSSDMPAGVPPKKARTHLGREYDCVVFDGYQQFDIDAFGAVSGTLCGGGFLFLIIPVQSAWTELRTSRFLRRALPLLKYHEGVYFVEQGKTLPVQQALPSGDGIKIEVNQPYRTIEQQQLVNEIESTVIQKTGKPVVIVSDRGRGKTSSLGLAAARLMQQGIKNIIITAPRLSVSDPLFYHAQKCLPGAMIQRGCLEWEDAKLSFIAPDALLIDRPDTDLLMIDEAAAIPLPVLEQFLHVYPQVIFATTIHGYEGTGRGFTLKFNGVLDRLTPGWLQFKMETPIRWASDDPVERWIDKLLGLDVELPDVPLIQQMDINQCKVKLLDRDKLIEDEENLSSLFSLLVYAHYRTQPSDFKYMLDDVAIRVYTLEYQDKIIAAVLINQEGGFDKQLSSLIYLGERRPQGNLLPQTLSFHAGCENAATLNYARVMRIAVHPLLQAQGLGTLLIKEICQKEKENVDAIGTSFGATPDLLKFWKQAGFEIVRIGFTQDHASGTHSAVMLLPFSENGKNVFRIVRDRFQRYVSNWLAGPLAEISESIRSLLQAEAVVDTQEVSDQDWMDIRSFACSHRGYEACMTAVEKLVRKCPFEQLPVSDKDKLILKTKVIQNKSWFETARVCGLPGKATTVESLRRAVSAILEHYPE